MQRGAMQSEEYFQTLAALWDGQLVVCALGTSSREWYAATGGVAAWGLLSPHRQVFAYRIQKLRDRRQVLPVGSGPRALPVGGGPRNPEWYREDFQALLELLRADKIHPAVAERLRDLSA